MKAELVIPKKIYFRVFAALMTLLALTIFAAMFDLGNWNVIVALTIAIIKAVLVILFFMHVRYSTRLLWVFVSSGFFWLMIMITLILADYLTR